MFRENPRSAGPFPVAVGVDRGKRRKKDTHAASLAGKDAGGCSSLARAELLESQRASNFLSVKLLFPYPGLPVLCRLREEMATMRKRAVAA